MGDAAIEVRDGWKRLGDRDVLRGVTCEFPSHRASALVGPSGSGKTVLLRHLVGLERLDAGEVIVEGRPLGSMADSELMAMRQRWGVQPEGQGALFSSMTVAENLAFPMRAVARLPESEVREWVDRQLVELDLAHVGDLYPERLALGERTRAAFARAAAVRPRLLVVDSPERGHDRDSLGAFGRAIALTQERLECTLILVTQDVSLALALARHVVLLRDGEVAAQGSPAELRRSPDPFVRDFLGS